MIRATQSIAAEVLESSSYSDISIIVPTLNEVGSIGQLLADLAFRYPGAAVIVADDGSTDGTPAVVQTMAQIKRDVLRIEHFNRAARGRRGLTASVLDALERVKTPYFIVMDGDGQHPADAVKMIVDRLRLGFNLVVGTRHPTRSSVRPPVHRLLITKVFTLLARTRIAVRGVQVHDPMSGFFGGRTEVMRQVVRAHSTAFEPAGYKVLFDLLKVIPPSCTFAEVSYDFRERAEGRSKLSFWHGVYVLRALVR